jgi:hypothetical protein
MVAFRLSIRFHLGERRHERELHVARASESCYADSHAHHDGCASTADLRSLHASLTVMPHVLRFETSQRCDLSGQTGLLGGRHPCRASRLGLVDKLSTPMVLW